MSEIKTISTDQPFEQAIADINANDQILEGRIGKQIFNKYELDQLFTESGLSRQFKRLIALGNTIPTFPNWTGFKDESGYSIWKHPVTDYKHNPVNSLYFDDEILDYRGEASSESISAFDKVFTFDGSDYTDVTAEAGSELGTPFEILNDVTHFLYVGHAAKFASLNFDFETFGSGYTLKVEYWDGAAWTELSVTDETLNLASSGRVLYSLPDDWAQNEVNGETKYWLRISTTFTPSVIAKVYHLLPGTTVGTLLTLNAEQFTNQEWAWCYFNGNIYVTIRSAGQPYYEGSYFIKTGSSATRRENFFVHNHKYEIDYEDSTYIPDTGTWYSESSKVALTGGTLNLDSWQHSSDFDKVNGAKIYPGSIPGSVIIKHDTYDNLKAYAATNPTEVFLCIATDYKIFMLYCGDPSSGDAGFLTLAGFGEPIDMTEA